MVAGWRRDRHDSTAPPLRLRGVQSPAGAVLGVRARDVDCAFKLFRRSYFERVRLSSQGFLIDAELYARASRAGLRVAQLPVTHRPRAAGRSSVRPATIWRTLLHLWRLSQDLRREAGASGGRGRAAVGVRAAAGPVSEPVLECAGGNLPWLILLWPRVPCGPAGLAFQGSRGLWEPDEGRNVNIALGMLQSVRLDDPPPERRALSRQAAAAFLDCRRGHGALRAREWGARAAQALLFAADRLLVGALGGRLWDRRTGPPCGARLCHLAAALRGRQRAHPGHPARHLRRGARLRLLAGGVRGRLGALRLVAARRPRRRPRALAKGPALLVLLPPFALHLALRRRLAAALRSPGLWAGAALCLGLALAWYLPVALRHPGAAAYFLDNQVIGRLATATYRRNPGWQGLCGSICRSCCSAHCRGPGGGRCGPGGGSPID